MFEEASPTLTLTLHWGLARGSVQCRELAALVGGTEYSSHVLATSVTSKYTGATTSEC